MNLTVNENILQDKNLTLEEFLVLYLCSKECNIKEIIDSVITKGYAYKDLKDPYTAVISNETKDIIAEIIVDSDKKVINSDDDFNRLARKLREIYPEGKKPGTTYYWRDSTSVIAKKLKTLVAKFNFHFTEEEAIEATKKYVKDHKNDDRYMHLLKYFILKSDVITGDCKSEFMSIIENKEQKENSDTSFDEMRYD